MQLAGCNCGVPDDPRMVPRWSPDGREKVETKSEKKSKKSQKKVRKKSEKVRKKKSRKNDPGWPPDDRRMLPRWSPDGRKKIRKKLEKSRKQIGKKFAENDHFCHSSSLFSIKYKRATAPSFSLQCLLDGSSNLAQGYIFWESFVNPSGTPWMLKKEAKAVRQ